MTQSAQTDFPLQPAARGLAIGPRLLTGVLNRLSDRLLAGKLTIELPDGRRVRAAGETTGPDAAIKINRYRIARHIMFDGALGLADSYVAGDWESDDLTAVIELGAKNVDAWGAQFTPLGAGRMLSRLHQRLRTNTRRGSRRNIAAHYDLGNDFYAAWLDPSMTYSAACFGTDQNSERDAATEPVTSAQVRKFDQLAEMLELQPGDHMLEIGCGWGAFAIHAATHYGCRVTALTVSPSQAAWARRKVTEAGLDDRIEIRLQDYRDVAGTFDKIASIEMFEAVGEAYWPAFFGVVGDRLRPGGIAGMQVITIDEARFEAYRRNPDFIQLRVFPGGMLPSPTRFAQEVADAGLAVSDTRTFGRDYAETLRRWRLSFENAWPVIATQDFDETFRRLWRYYLSYCEAGFRAGNISVAQYRIDHAR
ncbi:MAG: class I SAM-dependent methyltransferase [Rhodospirillaceae bacterium]|jgi:cyclopropane-fatty-acyl-phospholipid synthase|nr:class I SAM-dependent methyltransferase [Rhodospirillaceae bacterium]MBT5943516.1 class I SAM-dependent methyltransferase [Rhodospirillaceae bacterium]MBT6404926.1 class I SAM-dependent methyltransferase [Rhodospirillaceae bacterium]MBT6537500.1 class I SAM-dependent methyltransferase [Rhodospirillaceae bacterium]MBT7363023.1 class I SAM-dependent methyltransferase [Rhodospirillaceae bacterium]